MVESHSEKMVVLAAAALLLLLWCQDTTAFSTTQQQRSILKMQSSSLLDKLPNPFSGKSRPASIPSALVSTTEPQPFQPTPQGLVTQAKRVLAADLGIQDERLLDDKFVWIGSSLGSKVLGKADYLAAGKFFDLRAAFPDLDYRAHDFRIDDKDPLTIRFTARTVGQMRGDLRLRKETLPPNGKQMRCPPEAISMTFDEQTGKLIKLSSGFTMDRLVGNTAGLCGVMGAAAMAGAPPSDWDVYPATTVVGRFFGRPVSQLEDPTSFLAPFPETVMIQLAKGILAADMAAADPDLLGSSFTFCTPFEGPVGKKKYLESYAQEVFGDAEPELTHFRVDPYDPYRVWVDVRPVGPGIEGPPQATSFTFDDEGFCTRLTAWAVMDPSSGNAGGLGGVAGIRYAEGSPLPGIASRPLPQVVGRLRKRIFEPFTKVGVDDYALPGSEVEAPVVSERQIVAPEPPVSRVMEPVVKPKPAPKKAAVTRPEPPSITPPPFFERKQDEKPLNIASLKAEQAAAAKKAKAEEATAAKKAKAEEVAAAKKAKAEEAAAAKRAKEEEAAAAKKARAEAAAAAKEAAAQAADQKRREVEEKRAAAGAAAGANAKAARAAAEQQRLAKAKEDAEARQRLAEERKAAAAEAAERKRGEAEEKKAAVAAAAQAKQQEVQAKKAAAEEARKRAAEEKKRKAEAAAEARRQQQEAREAAAQAKQQELQAKKAAAARAKQSEKAVQKAKPGATISLFGFGRQSDEEKEVTPSKPVRPTVTPKKSAAPRGVPTISGWKQNRDGSISGRISGSPNFEEGGLVTTSPISGDAAGGTVVQTASGSKYYLEPKAEAPSGGGLFGAFGGGARAAPPATKAKATTRSEATTAPPPFFASPKVEQSATRVKAQGTAAAKKAKAEEAASAKKAKEAAAAAAKKAKAEQAAAAKKAKAEQAAAAAATKKAKAEAAAAAKKAKAVQAAASKKAKEESVAALQRAKAAAAAAVAAQQKAKTTKVKTAAPKGVATLKKWRKNRDGSITGLVSGTDLFEEGERITTSEIASGDDLSSGNVVVTASGSKYFLS